MKNLSIALGLFLVISGCAVLTETQLGSIKQYAAATQEYADYPGMLIRDYVADTANYPSHAFDIIQLDTRVAEIYDEIYLMETLNEKLVASISDLYAAHHSLNINLQEKQKTSFILSEVSEFTAKVHELMKITHED